MIDLYSSKVVWSGGVSGSMYKHRVVICKGKDYFRNV